MLAESVRDLIVADAAATALLATYEFSTGTDEPAIFTDDRIPEDCARPAVEILEMGGDEWGTRTRSGTDSVVSVRVMGNRVISQLVLREAAMAVREALNRKDIHPYTSGRGYDGIAVFADAPSAITDENGFPGYLIALRIVVIEN